MSSCSGEEAVDADPSLWKCPLCLDTFKSPKLLPCSHTFCEACLEDLLKHQDRNRAQFSCPSCREKIPLPSGGVSAFKTNYYLEAARIKEKQQLLCKDHDDKPRELELFCHQCNKCICLKCKLEDHSDHRTEDIEMTSKTLKTQLSNDMTGLNSTIADLERQRRCFSAEQTAVQEKRRAVEKEIRDRHRMMVSVADKCRDDALFSLDTITASIESQLEEVVNKMKKSLDALSKLKKRMDKCLKGEEGSGLVVMVQDIYQDATAQEKEVQRLLHSQITTVSRPVLRYTATADVTLSMERSFLTGVDRVDMAVSNIHFDVEHLFSCSSAGGACEVFSVFPRIDETVWIAYEVGGASEDTVARCPELFTLGGIVLEKEKSVRGRTNFTHTYSGTGMCAVQVPGSFQTYAKSRSLFKLKNHLNGTADVSEVLIKGEDPLETIPKTLFSIQCGPHRAFDVHESKTLFAVVEEAQPPQTQRTVHVYQLSSKLPAATYLSPVQPFQPSDVCFYKLGSHHVLLVADELNDVIHVVQMGSGQLVFGCYLAAGCPLLIQPTALNTDFKGSVWVACRTGAVLVCQPA